MERFDVVEQEQLAAQVVAVIDAHFQRPTTEQKNHILRLAEGQIRAAARASFQPEELQRSEITPVDRPLPASQA